MANELRYAFRQMRRNVAFSATVIALLAIGIASSLVVFAFLHAFLLTPFPVKDASQLLLLERISSNGLRPEDTFSYAQFGEIAERSDLFRDSVAEQALSEAGLVSAANSFETRLVTTQIVSPNYFKSFGLSAALGRLFDDSDARKSSEIPVVLIINTGVLSTEAIVMFSVAPFT